MRKTSGLSVFFPGTFHTIKKLLASGTSLAFLLSLAICTHAQSGKFLGGIWKWNNVSECPASFTRLFNQVTPENAGKWGPCEIARGQFIWQKIDAMYAWSDSTGSMVKHHCFVWGQQEPSWIGSYSNADTVKAIVTNWIRTYLQRYGARTDLIDVVNEPLHAVPSYSGKLGGSGTTGWDWVVWVFQTTRTLCNQYAPNARLLLNDYNIIKDDGATTNYLKIINILKERNLIDGIGEQAHFYETTDTAVLRRNFNRLVATGLPVYISELDLNISDDQQQLDAYKQVFPIFWDNPAVKGVTLWGYQQGQMWRANAYLLRSDGTERPALTWLKGYIANTRVTFLSDGSKAVSGIPSSRLTFSAGSSGKGPNILPVVNRAVGNEIIRYTLNGSRIKKERVIR